jgi:hypothetical protein
MPDFKLFLVTDEGDRRRVCGGARAVVRRCTRTQMSAWPRDAWTGHGSLLYFEASFSEAVVDSSGTR